MLVQIGNPTAVGKVEARGPFYLVEVGGHWVNIKDWLGYGTVCDEGVLRLGESEPRMLTVGIERKRGGERYKQAEDRPIWRFRREKDRMEERNE